MELAIIILIAALMGSFLGILALMSFQDNAMETLIKNSLKNNEKKHKKGFQEFETQIIEMDEISIFGAKELDKLIQPTPAEAALNTDDETEDLSEWIAAVRKKNKDKWPVEVTSFPQGLAHALSTTEDELKKARQSLGDWIGAYRDIQDDLNAADEELRQTKELLSSIEAESKKFQKGMLAANVTLREKLQEAQEKIKDLEEQNIEVDETADYVEVDLYTDDDVVDLLNNLAVKEYVKDLSEEALAILTEMGGYYNNEKLEFRNKEAITEAAWDKAYNFVGKVGCLQ